MRMIPRTKIIALVAMLAMAAGAAGSDLPSQDCAEQSRALASRFLAKSPLAREIVSSEPSVETCTAWPGKERFHLAAFVYDTPNEEDKRMLVTLLDLNTDKVLATYWTKVDADATTPYYPGSVSIDRAPYHLRPGVRAFGIDVETRTSAGQESGHGIERSLYVREGNRIRPVLQRMVTSRWEYINGYQPYLNTQESPRPATEDFTYKISIAPTSHNGFADLRITRKSSVAGHPKVTELLYYDGKQYPNPRE